jgi:DNA-binding protein H-NS
MATLKELIAQKEALEQQIAETRAKELADAIAKVKALVEEHELTQSDIFGTTRGAKKAKAKSSKVVAKYRDAVSGKEWTGRGKAPLWIAGKDRTKYQIA